MKKFYLCLFLLIFGLLAQAQNISVANFHYAENDLTARTHGTSVEDQNGNLCALIKVRTTEKGLWSFDVGMLGVRKTELQIAAHPAEIWVYVPFGVTRITIQHEKLGLIDKWRFPCDIDKGCTYIMVLEATPVPPPSGPQQQYLTFQITPANAVLEVNGQLWEVGPDGSSTKFVDFGTYKYRVQAPNYHSDAGIVTVNDPENTQKVNVTLKPDFVEVTLKSDTDAEIWVNNEKKGVGTWTGTLGKGTYKIECKKVNHETSVLSQEITDALNGQTITLPAPKPIYGSLNIESTPNYATVFIDGKAVGETPKFVKEILVGTHEIKVRKDGHNDYVETATITKGERKQLKIILEEKDAETKGKELAWKNSFFPIFADKGEPFYYEIGLWDDDGPDTETEHKYKDINGKTYPDGILFAHNQRLAVEENGKWMIYSVDGKKIGPFDGLPDLHLFQQQDTIKILKDGKCGLIDKDGNQLIPPIYENLEAFKNLQEMISPQLYMAEKNGKMGVINIHNDIVEPFEFTPSWRSVYDFVVEKDGKYGCLDALTGKLLIPCRYKYIKTKGDIIIVQNEEDRWEVYNREGNLIHPFKYSYISDWESSGMIYKLDKEKNGISSLMNSKGKIIANDCCALGITLKQFDSFVYCRWTNKEKDEKEWCLADINTGEVKSVIDPRIAEDLGLKTKGGGWRTAWQGRYFIGSKNKNTNEEEQGVWDLFTQKLVIPYSLGKIHVEYDDSNEIVSCTRYSDQDNNTPCDITFYNFPEGKVTNTYKDVMISGFSYFSEKGMYRWNYVILNENNKGLVVDDFGNPIISCECWNDGEGNSCYNLCRTGHYILDSNKGVYDTKGNLLIEGKYSDILEDNDLKCVVLYRLGDNRKTGKNRECYVFENGKLKQVEDKGSLSELVFSIIQQKCH